MEGEVGGGASGRDVPRLEVDGYQVLGILGRGGFATVYRALQVSVGREVALKVVALRTLDEAGERRFHREVRAVGSLSGHPHVVAIYDAGTTATDEPFISMQLVEDGSWGDHVRRHGPLAADQVAAIGADVVDALEAAHGAGITHRDIKPDNLLVGPRRRTLVSDFGIATLGDGTQTATGTLTGTLAFTAPELLQGGQAGPASDVFALGATLYALLVGRSPFSTGEEDHAAAVIWRIANEEPPALPPTVPLELRTLVGACTAKDPARRPQVEALGGHLRDLSGASGPIRSGVVTEVTPAPPPGAPESLATGTGRRRWRWLVAGATATLAVAVIAAVVVTIARGGSDEASPGPAREGSASTSTTTTAAPAGPGTAMPQVSSSLVVRDDPSGVAATPTDVWVTHSNDGTVSRIDAATNRVVASIEVGLFAEGIAVTPDAVWVTHNETEGTVSRIDPATNEVVATVTVGERPLAVAIGPDAVWVSNEGDETVSRIDPATDEVEATISVGDSTFGLAVAPSAVWVATLSTDLRRIDPATDQLAASIEVEAPGVGRDVAVVGSEVWLFNAARPDPVVDGSVTRIDALTNEVLMTTDLGTDPSGVAVGEGDVWVVSKAEGDLTRLSAATGEVTGTVEVGGGLEGVATADGVLWVTVSDEDTVVRLDA